MLVFASRNDAAATVDRFIYSKQLDKNAPEYAQSIRQSLSGMDTRTFSEWAMKQVHNGKSVASAIMHQINH